MIQIPKQVRKGKRSELRANSRYKKNRQNSRNHGNNWQGNLRGLWPPRSVFVEHNGLYDDAYKCIEYVADGGHNENVATTEMATMELKLRFVFIRMVKNVSDTECTRAGE